MKIYVRNLIFVLFVAFRGTKAAGGSNGDSCDNGSNTCDTSKKLYCHWLQLGCTYGTCMCPSGYTWSGSTCKIVVSVNGDCTDTATRTCGYGTSCTSNTCSCGSGEEFLNLGSAQMACVTSGGKKYSEACSGNDTCVVTGTSCQTSTCKCTSGLIYANNICRSPMYGESCDGTNTCLGTASVLGSSTNTQFACTSTTCVCPANTEYMAIDGSYGTCVNTGTGDSGDSCTTDGNCKSRMKCVACPALSGQPTNNSTCRYLNFPSSSNGMIPSTVIVTTAVIAKMFLFY